MIHLVGDEAGMRQKLERCSCGKKSEVGAVEQTICSIVELAAKYEWNRDGIVAYIWKRNNEGAARIQYSVQPRDYRPRVNQVLKT